MAHFGDSLSGVSHGPNSLGDYSGGGALCRLNARSNPSPDDGQSFRHLDLQQVHFLLAVGSFSVGITEGVKRQPQHLGREIARLGRVKPVEMRPQLRG